jgi:cytochrome P450
MSNNLLTFDLQSAAFRANPYPTYARMRSEAPLHRGPLGAIQLSRYEDCHAILKDHRYGREGFEAILQSKYGKDPAQSEEQGRSMLFCNPPDHTRLRTLVNRAFTSRVIEAMRGSIQGIVDALLDRHRAAGRMDLIKDLAYPLPFTVICDMLGLPLANHSEIKAWSDDISRGLDAYGESAFAIAMRGERARRKLREYLRGVIAERRKAPRQDLLSLLIAAEEAGDKLSSGELVETCMLLFLAGHETTMNLIGNGTLALLRHPEQLARLRAQPDLLGSAVEEMLRYEAPLQSTARILIADVEFRGRTLSKGTMVNLTLGAANRDPDQFADPDAFDIARRDNRHLSFGFGIHFCIGAMLARMEAQIAIATLLERYPCLTLTTAQPQWQESFTLRGLEHLPVAF